MNLNLNQEPDKITVKAENATCGDLFIHNEGNYIGIESVNAYLRISKRDIGRFVAILQSFTQ